MPLVYKTIGASTMGVLIELVNFDLAAGWRPQGGLVITNPDGVTKQRTFYQALVREEEPENTTGAET